MRRRQPRRLETLELPKEKIHGLGLHVQGNVRDVDDRVCLRLRNAQIFVILSHVPETPTALARAPVLVAHGLVIDVRSSVVGAEPLVVEVEVFRSVAEVGRDAPDIAKFVVRREGGVIEEVTHDLILDAVRDFRGKSLVREDGPRNALVLSRCIFAKNLAGLALLIPVVLHLQIAVVLDGAVQQLARHDEQEVELVRHSIAEDSERLPVVSMSGEVHDVWLGDVRQIHRDVLSLYRTKQPLGAVEGLVDLLHGVWHLSPFFNPPLLDAPVMAVVGREARLVPPGRDRQDWLAGRGVMIERDCRRETGTDRDMVFVDEVSVDVLDNRLLEVDECGPVELVLEVPVRADDADSRRRPAPRRWRARRGFVPDVKRFAWGSASGGLAARIGRANGHPPERGRVRERRLRRLGFSG
ncbi:hypothetical protein THAOC_30114 [Thalassiosira oceanica]|uniref:Uncharacterized protein n=1 Tax=Thalassiosira oceanica TaxID=159749 RepID=K0RPH7_THAOC|nr:hypothetical protein THAOC_30114 [Thalassiosira oceanica]|eukprot:EJK50786.1 hypothetical protein THAOC_30114 [Thalassiosira oceanica]